MNALWIHALEMPRVATLMEVLCALAILAIQEMVSTAQVKSIFCFYQAWLVPPQAYCLLLTVNSFSRFQSS